MAQYQWADIERLVNDPNATEIQRQETAKQLAGAWVQMTGQVDDVSSSSYDSGLSVSMKCGAQSLLSDTWVEMRPDQKDVLLQYTKGSTLTVIARFKSHDSFGHRYTDGKVIR